MAASAQKMVHDAVEAFIKQDVEEAEEIIRRDDEVDALFNQVKSDVVELLKSAPSHADQGIDLLMIAKYLERIGDHAVNVCEWTQFCKTGALKNLHIMHKNALKRARPADSFVFTSKSPYIIRTFLMRYFARIAIKCGKVMRKFA